jgi:hypothetical protein
MITVTDSSKNAAQKAAFSENQQLIETAKALRLVAD